MQVVQHWSVDVEGVCLGVPVNTQSLGAIRRGDNTVELSVSWSSVGTVSNS